VYACCLSRQLSRLVSEKRLKRLTLLETLHDARDKQTTNQNTKAQMSRQDAIQVKTGPLDVAHPGSIGHDKGTERHGSDPRSL
jgi:hypothetical protein